MRRGNNRCQSSEVGGGLAHSEASEVTECAVCGGVLMLPSLGTSEIPLSDTIIFTSLSAKREIFCSSRGFEVDK